MHGDQNVLIFGRNVRAISLAIRGPRLFNLLPKSIRDRTNCTTEVFKIALDAHLASVPDEPPVPGLTQFKRAETSSLIDWAAYRDRGDGVGSSS